MPPDSKILARVKKKGSDEWLSVFSDQAMELVATGEYEIDPESSISLVRKEAGLGEGQQFTVPVKELSSYLAEDTFRISGTQDWDKRHYENLERELYSGLGHGAKAALEGAAAALTAEGSDWLLDKAGAKTLKRKKHQKTARVIGGVVGTLAPLSALSKASHLTKLGRAGELGLGTRAAAATVKHMPAGVAVRAGLPVAEKLGGVGGLAAGGFVEGAVYGMQSGIVDALTDDDPFTMESIVSEAFTTGILGGAIGAGVGAAAKGVGGIAKAVGRPGKAEAAILQRESIESLDSLKNSWGEYAGDAMEIRTKYVRDGFDTELPGPLVEAEDAYRRIEAILQKPQAKVVRNTTPPGARSNIRDYSRWKVAEDARVSALEAGNRGVDLSKLDNLKPTQVEELGDAMMQYEKAHMDMLRKMGGDIPVKESTVQYFGRDKREISDHAKLAGIMGVDPAMLPAKGTPASKLFKHALTFEESGKGVSGIGKLIREAKGATVQMAGWMPWVHFRQKGGIVNTLIGAATARFAKTGASAAMGMNKESSKAASSMIAAPGAARVAIGKRLSRWSSGLQSMSKAPKRTALMASYSVMGQDRDEVPEVSSKLTPDQKEFVKLSYAMRGTMQNLDYVESKIMEQFREMGIRDFAKLDGATKLAMDRLEYVWSAMPKQFDPTKGPYVPSKSELRVFNKILHVIEDPLALWDYAMQGKANKEMFNAVMRVHPETFSLIQSQVLPDIYSNPNISRKVKNGFKFVGNMLNPEAVKQLKWAQDLYKQENAPDTRGPERVSNLTSNEPIPAGTLKGIGKKE